MLTVLGEFVKVSIIKDAESQLKPRHESQLKSESTGPVDGEDLSNSTELDESLFLLVHPTVRHLLSRVTDNVQSFRSWLFNLGSKDADGNPVADKSERWAGSDSLELARDALRSLLSGSAVNLDEAAKLIAELKPDLDQAWKGKLHQLQRLRRVYRTDWAILSATGPSATAWASLANAELPQGLHSAVQLVAKALTDPQRRVLADRVQLFAQPSDLLNDFNALRPARSLKPARDIVRKSTISPAEHAVYIDATYNSAHVTSGQRRTRLCLRCEGLSDVDTFTPASQSLRFLDVAFRSRCICGGLWWLV